MKIHYFNSPVFQILSFHIGIISRPRFYFSIIRPFLSFKSSALAALIKWKPIIWWNINIYWTRNWWRVRFSTYYQHKIFPFNFKLRNVLISIFLKFATLTLFFEHVEVVSTQPAVKITKNKIKIAQKYLFITHLQILQY